MNWKVCFSLRRTIPQFLPVCIALVFNRAASTPLTLAKIEGASLAYYQLSNSFVYKRASGEWDVSFSCEVNVEPLPPRMEAIGIDVGLENFATLFNEQKIPNPRFFKKGEKVLAKAQRKLAKLAKGTRERSKQGKAVAKIHEKINNQRKDFCHKQAR